VHKEKIGTPHWFAPELINCNEEHYSTSVDIWSFGITAIELAHKGAPPYVEMNANDNKDRLFFEITNNPSPKLDEKYSQSFKDFVGLCLTKEVNER
jgi:Serine/threonine protein kinase